jgi:hypothetical protein
LRRARDSRHGDTQDKGTCGKTERQRERERKKKKKREGDIKKGKKKAKFAGREK